MSSNDAMSERNLQKHIASASNEQSPPDLESHTNMETCRNAPHLAQPEAVKQEAGTVVKHEPTENAPQPPLELSHISTNVQGAPEHGDQEPRLLKQEQTNIKSEHAARQATPRLLLEGASQDQDTASEPHLEPSTPLAISSEPAIIASPGPRSVPPISKNRGTEKSSPAEPTLNEGDNVRSDNAAHEQESEVTEPTVTTSESLRGDPYKLSASRNAHPQEFNQLLTRSNEPRSDHGPGLQLFPVREIDGALGADIRSNAQSQLMGDGHQSSRATASKHPQPAGQDQDQDEDEDEDEPLSSDGEFVASSDDWDGDDDQEDARVPDEHVANMTSQIQRSVAKAKSTWKQRHEIFQDDGLEFQTPARKDDNEDDEYEKDEHNFRATQKIKNAPEFNGYAASRHSQRQPAHASSSRAPAVRPPRAGVNMQHHGRPRPPSFQPPNHHAQQMPIDFYPDPSSMSGAASMQYGMHPGGMQNPHQYALCGQSAAGYQNFGYSVQPIDRYPSHIRHPPLPISPFEMPVRHRAPPALDNQALQYHAMPAQRGMQYQGVPQGQLLGEEEEDDDMNDDEPLRTRVQHQQPKVPDPASRSSSPAFEPAQLRKKQARSNEFEVELLSSTNKQFLPKSTAVKKATSNQPVTQLAESQDATQSESAPAAEIDWKLPSYEVIYTPSPTKHDPGIAKISIPGLVREELLLSPDHAEQEAHLLLNIFIPAQKALPTPDLAPAVAVLNFHTITVMVIEAFVQFEIGDEFGTGRGHLHNEHDTEDGEYERLRNAKDADEDEIFFAVIDRWRAAMESGKDGAMRVRGVQEFTDISLEIIYYIKRHGLLVQRERAVRSNKGVKRRAKRVGEGDEEKMGAKRKAKVNEVPARKKAKVEKPKAKEPAKRKPRAKEPALTVVKAPPRKR